MLTRVTIWLALALYAAAEIDRRAARPDPPRLRARVLWTAGALLYLAHVAAAFGEHHHWSHAAAYAHTARATEALIGLHWGGGIFVNYAFTAVWLGEAAWWWIGAATYQSRPQVLDRTVRAVFLFMIVNGAVVFVDGPQRGLGVGLVVVLLLTWGWPGQTDEAGDRRRP